MPHGPAEPKAKLPSKPMVRGLRRAQGGISHPRSTDTPNSTLLVQPFLIACSLPMRACQVEDSHVKRSFLLVFVSLKRHEVRYRPEARTELFSLLASIHTDQKKVAWGDTSAISKLLLVADHLLALHHLLVAPSCHLQARSIKAPSTSQHQPSSACTQST